jgi:hypothetical protein
MLFPHKCEFSQRARVLICRFRITNFEKFKIFWFNLIYGSFVFIFVVFNNQTDWQNDYFFKSKDLFFAFCLFLMIT